jgi:RNA polymerase sigma factor (sigma-70 family)
MDERTASLLCQHGQALRGCSICQSGEARTHAGLGAQLEELLAGSRPRLLRLAQLNGIAGDRAEDVVQETCIEAWQHLEGLREPARFAAWLDGICRNVCKRQLRASTGTLQLSALHDREDEANEASLDIPDPLAFDPVEELERQDMQALLDRALGHLSESARELVELCYLAELPQREVARRLDMSLGALELKLHRARRQLRQVFSGDLRADAREFGLLLNEDEAMGWRETRQWCWLCGKQRMRGIFERQPSGAVALCLRCPDCSPRYDVNIIYTGDWLVPGLAQLRSFRPAIRRVLLASTDYYRMVLHERRCNVCQSSIQLQLIEHDAAAPSSDLYTMLPEGIYLRIDCPNCGIFLSEWITTALTTPIVHEFILNRPRVLFKPNIRATYAGQNAIRSRLLDLDNNEQLTIMAHPETLQVMATFME